MPRHYTRKQAIKAGLPIPDGQSGMTVHGVVTFDKPNQISSLASVNQWAWEQYRDWRATQPDTYDINGNVLPPRELPRWVWHFIQYREAHQ